MSTCQEGRLSEPSLPVNVLLGMQTRLGCAQAGENSGELGAWTTEPVGGEMG